MISNLGVRAMSELISCGEIGISPGAVAQAMTVKKVDLNADGQLEYVVALEETVPLGSLCGALANCPDWVYRKTGSEYQLLLRTRGRELVLERTLTNKFLDLRSEGGDTAFQGSFVNYKFDGNKYQAKGCYTRTYATKTQKEKIAPIKCQENN